MGGLPPSAQLLGIGFYVAICIVLGTAGGLWLDGEMGTGRLLTIVGLLVGLFMALYGGYKQLMDVLAQMNRRRTEDKRGE